MRSNQSQESLIQLLTHLKFKNNHNIWTKNYPNQAYLKVDFEKEILIYPTDQGFKVNGEFTTNFSSSENFVVFECVDRLFSKGYKPEHIELEPKWKLGHGASGGRADIFVRDQDNKPLLIIECKTAGKEFDRAWKKTLDDGDQLFSYIEQEKDVKFVCLYASELDNKNDELTIYQRIISHRDNLKILEESDQLLSFEEAKNVKERYRVWKETYNLEYTETGIFEDNVQAYQIGKDKYTLLHDTKPIGSTDKKGKYNQFATILRKYNVSRKENAFEVLVNLFLCKIVDETLNPTDLKFYWKGIAYDNYFDFVDRLQELYQKGMEKYLEQEITYVSNDEIDGAFWTYANKKNATRTTIKELFKKLKFFNDNNFGFIGVKNKEGFEKNAKILLEVTQMWQGLQLKTKEQNQFLGDMFEFFLDSGVKQSEGQYFTPVPICKFILNSLPLENMVSGRIEPLRTIDYACGSGHFLTEYSHQIESIAKNNNQNPNDFYHNVYGIEKEDRLAKVSKVSAFMYGFDGINILDADALVANPKIKEESFDVLIANPPFAVKEFLTMLSEEDRARFELTGTVSDFNTNDDIQNFFLERAKQLMTAGGVAGIVIPNTILSNTDRISVQTREILLRYFNFISIVELPSATFGKTGTNTVVIYLERKAERPEVETHYISRVESWFEYQDINNADYKDKHLLEAYCVYCEFNFDDYNTLLSGKPSRKLLELEMFVEYRSNFDNLTDTKNLIKSRNFITLTTEKQELELNKKFTEYLTKIEKDKLYYFILAYTNPRPVLIVRSPSDTKLAKKFLGYEWSGSKGSEGIRYNGGETVHDIITEMFNPKDREDTTKISYWVRQNFIDTQGGIPTTLTQYCQYHQLTNLLDFSRTSFDKAISLTPKKSNSQTEIKSKWESKRLESLLQPVIGKITKIEQREILDSGTLPVITQEQGKFISGYTNNANPITDLPLIVFGDHSCNFKFIDFPFVRGADGTQLLKIDPSEILPKYLFNYLQFQPIENSDKYERHFKYLKNLKIPLPPLEIQNQIVVECNIVEQSVEKAKLEIERLKGETSGKIKNIGDSNYQMKKLSEVISLDYGIALPESKRQNGIYPVMGSNGISGYHNEFLVKAPCIVVGRKGSAGKLNFVEENCTPIDTTFYIKDSSQFNLKYIYYQLKNLNLENLASGSAVPGLNRNDAYQLKIPVPPIEVQNEIVAQIQLLETQIADNQAVIDNSKSLKQAILDKYLK